MWLDRDPRVLTIIGPGGTGKTRFSIELARFLAEEADGGTVFVPLAPRSRRSLVRPTDRRRAWAPPVTTPPRSRRGSARSETHVVLDNLEQLLPDAARPLAELLAAAPALRIVATSREPLRIAGEVEFDLPPMDEGDAVTLFIERAQAVRADVGDSPAVHELIRRLDGLPLAIELAAARVKLLGPEQLLERIGAAARPAQGRPRRRRAPCNAARHDRLELRPARRRRTAALRPARGLPRRLHARRGRGGL